MTPSFILSVGTQVVLRMPVATGGGGTHPAGTVAEVVQSPADSTHAYRVRFADGSEAAVRRAEIAVLKQVQSEGLARPSNLSESGTRRLNPSEDLTQASPWREGLTGASHRSEYGTRVWHLPEGESPPDAKVAASALDEFNLGECVIYRCIVGSRAYGLSDDDSDVDHRGIYLPSAETHWSLYGAPEQLDRPQTEECYWEIQKFITLALKANPNVLECLYTPLVELVAPPAQELLAMRDAFLSRLIYQTYNGYALSQFKKIDVRLREGRDIKGKHAMHLIRLLLSGITALREGVIPVAVDEHREHLLKIRRGLLPWREINEWRLELHRRFDEAFEATTLPERPDYERANAFLLHARRQAPRAPRRLSSAFIARCLPPASEIAGEAETLRRIAAAHPHPLIFATVSGAHLYGFPSPDSDYDLRGAHVLPLERVLGLTVRDETLERSTVADGLEIDLVTHDVHKFFTLMLKRNGYVLEQLLSPRVVLTTPWHEELKALARGCITRHHVHHYLGFARTEWSLFEKGWTVKALLYVYRVLLTGIHLMRTGEVEANLRTLNEAARLAAVDDLIAKKTAGREKGMLEPAGVAFHEAEYARLAAELEQAGADSSLPDAPRSRAALEDLLIRIRRSTVQTLPQNLAARPPVLDVAQRCQG